MTTYFISNNGDDTNAGTSAALAIKTLEKLQTLLASGDTAYFEAGVYTPLNNAALVFTASGADANNRIKWIGDIKGEYFDTKGYAVLSTGKGQPFLPYSGRPTSTSAALIEIQGNFYHFENLKFISGERFNVLFIEFTGSTGHLFYRCHVETIKEGSEIEFDYSGFTADAPNATTIDSCVLEGPVAFGIALPYCATMLDTEITVRNCLFICGASSTGSGIFRPNPTGTSNTYVMGGFKIYHNTFLIGSLLGGTYATSWEKIWIDKFVNNLVLYVVESMSRVEQLIGELGSAEYLGNRSIGTGVAQDVEEHWNNWSQPPGTYLGGFDDAEYYREFGVSPYQMWEPYHEKQGVLENYVVAAGEGTSVGCERDIYGNLRGNSPKTWLMGTFNNENAVTVDPDSVWTTSGLFGDFEYFVLDGCVPGTYYQGSNSSNYITGSGIGADKKMTSHGLIHDVKFLIQSSNAYSTNPPGGAVDMGYEIVTSTDEVLATGTITGIDVADTDSSQINEIDLDVPTGGWSHAVLEGLKIKIWKSSVGFPTNSDYLCIGSIIFRYQTSGMDTPGCVQSYNRPVSDIVETNPSGNPSLRIDGAGIYQVFLPVPTAAEYEITASIKIDSDYTGTHPAIETRGLVGQDDTATTISGVADTWVDTIVSVTPTEKGWVCVQIISKDTSGVGACYIGGVTIALA